jgi:hypothetical protein
MAQFQMIRNHYYGRDAEQRGTCIFPNTGTGAGLVQFNKESKHRVALSFGLNIFDLQGNVIRTFEYIPTNGDELEVKQIRNIVTGVATDVHVVTGVATDVIVGGTIYHTSANNSAKKVPFLMRINAATGNIVWIAELNSLLNIPNDDVTLVDFDLTNTETIIFVAKRFNPDKNATTMIVGDLEYTTGISSSWTKEFLPTGYDEITPRALTLAKDKNIAVITGSVKEQNSTRTAAFLTFININGTYLSTQVLRPLDGSSSEGIGICEDSNSSSILVTGSELDPNNSPLIGYKRLFVARSDYNNTLNNYSIYENPFGYSNSWVGTKIEVASNGTIVIAGANYTLPSASYNEGMFLVNVDGYGQLPATGYHYQGTPINLYYESLVTEGNLAWMGSTYLQGQNIYQIITDLNGAGSKSNFCPRAVINSFSVATSTGRTLIDMNISSDNINPTTYTFEKKYIDFGNFYECNIGAKIASNNQNTTISLISPNPAIDELTVNTGEATFRDVSIFDISGRKVFSKSSNEDLYQLNLSVSDLVSGTYIVQIVKTSGEIERSKLIIQK